MKKKILKFTEMDKKSKPYELKEIKRRIEQRIEVISKELTQNADEENGEAEEEKSQSIEPKNEQMKNTKIVENSQIYDKNQNKPQSQTLSSSPRPIPER